MNIRMTEEQYIAHQRMATAAKMVKPMDAPKPEKPKRVRKRKPPVRTEHEIQTAFIARLKLLSHPELALGFAVPNGGFRNAVTGARLKAEGVRKGVPDFCVPVPRKGFTSLWIEFKRPGGKLSEHQVEYIALLRREDHFVEVCDDDAEAEIIVRRYLGEDIPRPKR